MRIIVLLCLIFFVKEGRGDSVLQIIKVDSFVSIDPYLSYYRSESKELDLAQILSLKQDFKSFETWSYNAKFENEGKEIWFNFKIENCSDKPLSLVLTTDFSRKCSFYVVNKDIATAQKKDLILDSKLDVLYMDFDDIIIDRVVYNLISNAIKFTKQGDKLSVVMAKENDAFVMRFKD